MKKKKKVLLSMLLVCSLLTGCSEESVDDLFHILETLLQQPETNTVIPSENSDAEPESEPESEPEPEPENLFEKMPQHFSFEDGTGSWMTSLSISPDGAYDGVYYKTDRDDVGETYPSGTMWICEFTGHFSQPTQVSEYCWVMNMEDLTFDEQPGTERYENGTRYIAASPYGLEKARELLIYLPEKPAAEMPEFMIPGLPIESLSIDSGNPASGSSEADDKKNLNTWCIYNVNEETAFYDADQKWDGIPSFPEVPELPERFDFSSGVGAWNTELFISPDGTFRGMHHDSDMGDSGEAYPNGTVYTCEFTGQFSQPEQLNEYCWRMYMERLTVENALPEESSDGGETEPQETSQQETNHRETNNDNAEETDSMEIYKDGVRYVSSVPYGLENAEEILLYLPGTPVSEIPPEALSWLHIDIGIDVDVEDAEDVDIENANVNESTENHEETENKDREKNEDAEKTLNVWCLYNVNEELAFVGCNP